VLPQGFFRHPGGQKPDCEWNFGDVNSPVHAWAAILLYRTERAGAAGAIQSSGAGDSGNC
jgi:hypothetical protein